MQEWLEQFKVNLWRCDNNVLAAISETEVQLANIRINQNNTSGRPKQDTL